MMAVTTEDVAEAVKQLWNDNGTLTALVTSLVYGRNPQGVTAPYTAFTVRDGKVQMTSQGTYLAWFTLEFRTWVESAAAAAQNSGPIKLAIEATFSIANRPTITLANERQMTILHGIKQAGALEEDNATKQAQAVKVSTDRFEFLCQG